MTASGERLELRYRWWSRRVIVSLMAIGSGVGLTFSVHPTTLVGALCNPFALMAWVGLYIAVAYLLNRTVVTVDREAGRLEVQHRPVWWPGGQSIPLPDVRQLYVKMFSYGRSGRRTYEFVVMAKLARRASDLVLVNGPLDPSAARAFEDTLELYLGIPDEPVRGEYDG